MQGSHDLWGCLRAVDVEAFSAAAKAALKGKDSLDVNKEEFKAVFVGECCGGKAVKAGKVRH